MTRLFSALTALACLYHAPAAAEEARFQAVGKTLFFNSNIPYSGDDVDEIINRDSDELGLILMEQTDITTIVLESEGGSTDAALKMAAKIEQFGLATEVAAGCYSACPYIFLGGNPRHLRTGGVLGFHRSSIGASELKALYARARSPDIENYSPGEFSYNDAINAAVEDVGFMVRHGVAPDFALEVINTPHPSMWEPSREVLIKAGILNDE